MYIFKFILIVNKDDVIFILEIILVIFLVMEVRKFIINIVFLKIVKKSELMIYLNLINF